MRKSRIFSLLSLLILGTAASISLTGCSKGHDYVGDCKLNTIYDYHQTNFLDHGLGEVELKQTVDGDTAHFYQKENSRRVVKVRFLGIDTPESTGQLEPWGKAASSFTSTKLLEAKTIVLSADIPQIGHPAEFDSTGTRYKGFVWISDKENASKDELRLLNLWVVQEGFSNAKSITDSPLVQYFLDADMQAQDLKRGQWKGDDPNFYVGAANETDLKTLAEAYESDGDESSWNGAKIAVTGVVYKVVGGDCYINEWITDPISGETAQYGLFIFSGYKSYRPLKKVGARIRVVGNYQIRYGNPQLTNVKYDALHPSDDDMSIIEENVGCNIPEVSIADVKDNILALNRVISIKGLHATGGYDEMDATTLVKSGAFTVDAEDDNGNAVDFRVPDDVWVEDETPLKNRVTTFEYFMTDGMTFDVVGAVEMFISTTSGKVTYQIKLVNKGDCVVHFANN